MSKNRTALTSLLMSIIITLPAVGKEVLIPGMRIRPPSLEQPAGSTGGLVSFGPGKIATLDIERKKVFLADVEQGRVVNVDIPDRYYPISSIRPNGAVAELVSPTGEIKAHLLLLESFSAGKIKLRNIKARSRSRGQQKDKGYEIIRAGKNSLEVSVKSQARATSRKIIRPVIGEQVATINSLVQLPDGSATIWWEELGHAGGESGAYALVGLFGINGRLKNAALVPNQIDAEFPENYVAIDSDGRAYYQSVENSLVKIRRLEMVDPRSLKVPIDQSLRAPRLQSPDERAFEEALRKQAQVELGEDSLRSTNRLQKPSREKIIATAQASLILPWIAQERNLKHKTIDNVCDVARGQYWQLPQQLSRTAGKKVNLFPYKWGGTSTPSSFIKRINSGALAGDICTCRDAKRNYCLVSEAAGVDCSGFVSNAWGVGRYTTSSLPSISKNVGALSKLLPGDILNHAGHHVRLFLRFEPGPEIRLRTLESAVSCGGVCEKTYTPVQLAKYKPLRFQLMD